MTTYGYIRVNDATQHEDRQLIHLDMLQQLVNKH